QPGAPHALHEIARHGKFVAGGARNVHQVDQRVANGVGGDVLHRPGEIRMSHEAARAARVVLPYHGAACSKEPRHRLSAVARLTSMGPDEDQGMAFAESIVLPLRRAASSAHFNT